MSTKKRDYYDILGVTKKSTHEEIKRAFRAKAMEFHPDRNLNNKAEAEKKFKEVNEAYEVLGDEAKRRNYDSYGHAGNAGGFGGGHAGGFEDINDIFKGFGQGGGFGGFEEFFGGGAGARKKSDGRQKGDDLSYNMTISLEEACFGKVNESISFSAFNECEMCDGYGSKDRSTTKCKKCNGVGVIRTQKGFFIMEQTCGSCGGSGEGISNPCGTCKGEGRTEGKRTVKFDIPAGVDNGMSIRISGKGDVGQRKAAKGDLYIKISIKQHDLFKRNGDTILCEVPISFTKAALGATIEVPTIDGKMAELQIPAGTQPDSIFSIKGKGSTIMNAGRRGDMKVVVKVEVPVHLNGEQKKLIKELDETLKPETSPQSNSFFSKVKRMFDK